MNELSALHDIAVIELGRGVCRISEIPAPQAMIKATRRPLAQGGIEWASDQRIHAATPHPTLGRCAGRPPATMRYYFGSREGLVVQVARVEHLQRLDQLGRALRGITTAAELSAALLWLLDAPEHYRVVHALLDASAAMPKLAAQQQELWADWRGRMREIVIDRAGARRRQRNVSSIARATFSTACSSRTASACSSATRSTTTWRRTGSDRSGRSWRPASCGSSRATPPPAPTLSAIPTSATST